MKQLLLCLYLLGAAIHARAQNYDVLSYHLNGTPENGVKIKTNLPFATGNQMPAIFIEGYCYGAAEPIGLTLTYYIYGTPTPVFTHHRISSWGRRFTLQMRMEKW